MSSDRSFLSFLTTRVLRPLPGVNAHRLMAPLPDTGTREFPEPEREASRCSVMILLHPAPEEGLELVLTLRSLSLPHGGQISFPGGQAEPGESPAETALRETEEEIGIGRGNIRIIGSLTELYLARSNNLIRPVIGLLTETPRFRPAPEEVQEAFTVPMDKLLAEENLIRERWTLQGRSFDVPYWNMHEVPLWGATAMIISELLELYKEFLGLRGNGPDTGSANFG